MAHFSFSSKQKIVNGVVTAIQYTTMTLFIVLTPKVAVGIGWQLVELGGIVLALWAVAIMRGKSKISIAPLPRQEAQLLTSGPYKIIRHPMYTSPFVMFVPLLVTHFDWFRAALLAVLYGNMIVKLLFEESVLREYFDGYEEYMKKTWRLFPFVF